MVLKCYRRAAIIQEECLKFIFRKKLNHFGYIKLVHITYLNFKKLKKFIILPKFSGRGGNSRVKRSDKLYFDAFVSVLFPFALPIYVIKIDESTGKVENH